jgi:hypothetical protein
VSDSTDLTDVDVVVLGMGPGGEDVAGNPGARVAHVPLEHVEARHRRAWLRAADRGAQTGHRTPRGREARRRVARRNDGCPHRREPIQEAALAM